MASTLSRNRSWSWSENRFSSVEGKKSSCPFASSAKPSSDSHSSRISFRIESPREFGFARTTASSCVARHHPREVEPRALAQRVVHEAELVVAVLERIPPERLVVRAEVRDRV